MQFQLPKTYIEISNVTQVYILPGKRSTTENISDVENRRGLRLVGTKAHRNNSRTIAHAE